MSAPALAVQQSGLSQVSGDNFNTFEQTCNNVSDLRGFIGTLGMQVYMRGYTTPGDGGQGPFYWNVNSTATDDGGITTITPSGSSTSGRWIRIGSVSSGSGVVVVGASRAVGLTDASTAFVATTSVTLTFSRTILLTNGYFVDIDAQGGSVTLAIDSNDTINVNGMSLAAGVSFIMPQGSSCRFYTAAASNWYINFLGPRLNIESTIVSATTTDLGSSSSNVVSVSGTTTITAFGSSASASNPLYFIRFTGALTLTYNASSLILPGAATITTAAGDTAIAKYEGSGNWRVLSYTPASGLSVVQPTVSTFTPTITFTTGTGTLSTAAGFYTKLGKLVTFSIQLVFSAVSSPTGVATIGNLPFFNVGTAGSRVAVAVHLTGMGATFTGAPVAYVDVSTNTIVLQEFAAGAASNPGAKFASTSNVSLAASYFSV